MKPQLYLGPFQVIFYMFYALWVLVSYGFISLFYILYFCILMYIYTYWYFCLCKCKLSSSPSQLGKTYKHADSLSDSLGSLCRSFACQKLKKTLWQILVVKLHDPEGAFIFCPYFCWKFSLRWSKYFFSQRFAVCFCSHTNLILLAKQKTCKTPFARSHPKWMSTLVCLTMVRVFFDKIVKQNMGPSQWNHSKWVSKLHLVSKLHPETILEPDPYLP